MRSAAPSLIPADYKSGSVASAASLQTLKQQTAGQNRADASHIILGSCFSSHRGS